MQRSTTTAIAVAVGTAVGVVAALDGGEPRRPAAAPVPSAPAFVEVRVGASAPPPVPATPHSASAAPSARAAPSASADPLDTETASALELACARREPRACLAAARAYAAGRGVEADAAKARLHRLLAVSLLDERCTAREPDACELLASLYASGTGVARNDDSARALSARALKLCEGKTDSSCEQIRAGLLR